MEAGVSAEAHSELLHEVQHLRENLCQSQSALEAVRTRQQTTESKQLSTKGQLDLLVRMLNPAARLPSPSQAPPPLQESGHDPA